MTARRFLVVVTGLNAEARLARAGAVRALAGGGDAARLEDELRRALADGAAAVLSFGLAAGLAPGCRSGSLVIPDQVIDGTRRYATDTIWSERLRAALRLRLASAGAPAPAADRRPLAGVAAPLVTRAAKLDLGHASGAIAADMESHLAARLAFGAGRPFAVLRAIADPAERALPPAALVGMRADGGIDPIAVLKSLGRSPGQVSALYRVAADARTAMAQLRRCRSALAPEFCWQPASPAPSRPAAR